LPSKQKSSRVTKERTVVVEITADFLAQSLEEAASTFEDGELAYTALTSKVELPLRDRLAWRLHKQLPHLTIAREWKRTDLAILDKESTPLALLEAKALYTFDIATAERANVRKYTARVKNDLLKSLTLLAGQPAATYALVLATHPLDPPPILDGVIKYRSAIHAALNRSPADEILKGAQTVMNQSLEPLGPILHRVLDAGTAFDTRVVISYWIVGPVAPSLLDDVPG
jgi:hypothetical protein